MLRYVWKKNEGRRTEPTPRKLPFPSGHRRDLIFAGTGPRWRQAVAAALLAASGMFWAPVAASADWASPVFFDPDKARQMRARYQPRQASPDDGWQPLDSVTRKTGLSGGSRFLLPSGARTHQLLALIAHAEAGTHGYDAVHHGTRILPRKPPTLMTLDEVDAWVMATPGQPHAIGRYQFIPATFREVRRRLGLPGHTGFTADVQDRMAGLLLADAGYHNLMSGQISLPRFMDRLARIWAGLPMQNGRSYYHGKAGNRATISRAFYERHMRVIFGTG